MMEVTTNSREILYINRKRPIERLHIDAGHFTIDEYYKGCEHAQEWGVKITPSSIHQAFLIWTTLHKLFLQEGIGYDKFILDISAKRTATVRIFYRRPSLAGVTTEMYYDGKQISTNSYERDQGNNHSLLGNEGESELHDEGH